MVAPFTAEFALQARGLRIGTTRWRLETRADGRHLFETESKATGLWTVLLPGERRESSVWELAGGSLKPLLYQRVRTDRPNRNATAEFDWNAGVIRSVYRGEQLPELPLKPGVLDNVLYWLALMQDLERGAGEYTYTFTDGRKLKTYTMRVTGEESLPSPYGVLDTLRVEHVSDDGERQTTAWCAESLAYLPVQVEFVDEKGERFRMTLTQVQGLRD